MHHNVRHWDLEQGRCHSAAVQREALSLVSHLKKEQLQGQVGIMHPASSRKCIMFPYGLQRLANAKEAKAYKHFQSPAADHITTSLLQTCPSPK